MRLALDRARESDGDSVNTSGSAGSTASSEQTTADKDEYDDLQEPQHHKGLIKRKSSSTLTLASVEKRARIGKQSVSRASTSSSRNTSGVNSKVKETEEAIQQSQDRYKQRVIPGGNFAHLNIPLPALPVAASETASTSEDTTHCSDVTANSSSTSNASTTVTDTSISSSRSNSIANNISCYVHPAEGISELLEDVLPEHIIVYEPDVRLIRELEMYQATHSLLQVQVYFIAYEDSVEKQRYLTALRREKEAFLSLIEQKSQMVIPVDPGWQSSCTRTCSRPLSQYG